VRCITIVTSVFGDIIQYFFYFKNHALKRILNMKKLQKTILLLVSLVSLIFAQNGEILGVQLENSASNQTPQLIKTEIQINAGSSDGIFIELPQGLTAVIRSASVDGNTLWLINSDQPVDKNNVLGWQLKDNGIVVHYSSDFSGRLNIEIAPDSARLNRFDQIDITIHQVTRNSGKLDVNEAIVSQSNLNIKQTTPTDEE